MISRAAEIIVTAQIGKGKIEEDERPIFQYGYELTINILINIVLAIIIAAIFRKTAEVAIFLIGYMPLRSYAGGHHAKTHERCTVVSAAILVILCLWLDIIPSGWYLPATVVSTVATGITVFLLAPVEDKNKPLTDGEKRVFGKRARLLLLLEALLIGVFAALSMLNISFVLSMCLCVLAIMMVLGYIKNRMNRKPPVTL